MPIRAEPSAWRSSPPLTNPEADGVRGGRGHERPFCRHFQRRFAGVRGRFPGLFGTDLVGADETAHEREDQPRVDLRDDTSG